jgi:hypothetical protein
MASRKARATSFISASERFGTSLTISATLMLFKGITNHSSCRAHETSSYRLPIFSHVVPGFPSTAYKISGYSLRAISVSSR